MEREFNGAITKRKMSLTATEVVDAPVFESRLSVFRVRANFVAPYRKCFMNHVQNVCRGWPNGVYFLKLTNGKVFARYEIVNDEVRTIFKDSPTTNKEYPVWDHFRRR